ncbi:cache domain-containing protein [Methanogenium cariaci]|jgi:cytochrome c
MRTYTILPVLALLMAIILVAGCTDTASVNQNEAGATPVVTPTPPPSPEELMAFVQNASEYAEVHGQEAALREFNNPSGQFVKGELYIFSYDLEGTTLALPFQPDLIGKSRWNTTDADGTAFIREMIEMAQSGGGFVRYQYLDPSDNNTVKPKLSYVVEVDQSWIIGSGIYDPE